MTGNTQVSHVQTSVVVQDVCSHRMAKPEAANLPSAFKQGMNTGMLHDKQPGGEGGVRGVMS